MKTIKVHFHFSANCSEAVWEDVVDVLVPVNANQEEINELISIEFKNWMIGKKLEKWNIIED